jgi:DNA-directed RNA polymerase I subunit RPA1
MTASSNIKTPYMELPLHPTVTEAEAVRLCGSISRLTLSAVLEKVTVKQSISPVEDLSRNRVYKISLHFLPKSELIRKFKLTQKELCRVIERLFIKRLLFQIARKLKLSKGKGDGMLPFLSFFLSFSFHSGWKPTPSSCPLIHIPFFNLLLI